MEEIKVYEELFRLIISNNYYIVATVLYIVGYMIKHHSKIDNQIIPWIMVILGSMAGYFVIAKTMNGLMSGLILGFVTIIFNTLIGKHVENYVLNKIKK